MTPTLTTERLILRPVRLDDAAQIADLTNDADVASMLGDGAFPNTLARAEGKIFLEEARALKGLEHHFAITLLDEGLIGEALVVLSRPGPAAVGYWLGRAYWGQGFGAEAMAAVSQFAAQASGTAVQAVCAADDDAAQRAFEKAGLKRAAGAFAQYSLVRRAAVACVAYRLAG